MSERVFRQLKDVCPDIECVELEKPLPCITVGGEVEVRRAVNVHVTLRTAAGPVSISSPVQCLIVPGDLEEFLLGKEMLAVLGIDVDRELEMLALLSHEEDSDEFDEPDVSPRAEVSDELLELVNALVEKARGRGFPADYLEELRRISTRFDLFRSKLGRDPPARVPPMRIRLKPGAKPYKCKARKYPPEVRRFMEEFNQQLEELGWIYENPNSRWACPALPVRKPSADGYRQTADYKPVNIQVEGIVGVMPNPQVDLELVKDCEFFGLFDFIKGYWQIALDEACQEILSYMTDRKIYTPRRVPQGCCDAALFFQATVEKCLQELLHKHLLVWIDDLMLYAKDVQTYLVKLERLFELLDFFGFKLSVTKSSLYEPQVKWCGKIISGRGVSHDPERIKALTTLPYPTNAGELQQFLCAANWMRESVIDFARVAKPLQEKLDEALATATRRTKRVASGIALDLGGSGRQAFDELKGKLQNAATLAFPEPHAVMCLITDASDVGYGLIVTQVRSWQAKKPVAEQQHELLVCVSGTFTGSKRNWSVIEKEAYPIIYTVQAGPRGTVAASATLRMKAEADGGQRVRSHSLWLYVLTTSAARAMRTHRQEGGADRHDQLVVEVVVPKFNRARMSPSKSSVKCIDCAVARPPFSQG
ncbi:hypothetical protein ON010_g2463 [Phytophthora cinnamomi]|nr:hypothetical protein ON010_g2463 [Phytophthora cinnamomi]